MKDAEVQPSYELAQDFVLWLATSVVPSLKAGRGFTLGERAMRLYHPFIVVIMPEDTPAEAGSMHAEINSFFDVEIVHTTRARAHKCALDMPELRLAA